MVQDKSLLLSIGNTGCGKSTMMTSLMFGTKALEVKNK
jgi:ABC-type dipeptide/oligopeptide/nickel transport system ATPase component